MTDGEHQQQNMDTSRDNSIQSSSELRSLVSPWIEEMTQRLSHSVKPSEVTTISKEISAWLTERTGQDIEGLLRQAEQLQERLPMGVRQHGTEQFKQIMHDAYDYAQAITIPEKSAWRLEE